MSQAFDSDNSDHEREQTLLAREAALGQREQVLSERELSFSQAESALAAKASELTQVVASLERKNAVNETLVRIGTTLNTELDLDAVVQKLTDEATALCRAGFGAFFYNVSNDAGESYTLYALSGVPREAFAKFPMPRNTAIFKPTFDGTAVLRLDDVTADPRYGKSAPYHGMPAGHLPVRSYLAVPVKSRSGEVLGGLFFGHAEPGRFTPEDEQVLLAVSAHAGVAIDNAKLFQAVRRAEKAAQTEREKLRELFMQSPALIVILRGPDHVYDFLNSAAAKLLGRDDVLGLPVREVLPEMPHERFELLHQVFATGQRYVGDAHGSVRDWDRNGRPYERFFNIVYEPYRDSEGRISGVMSFGFEVTDQVLANRKLEAVASELEIANRTKDEFLATVSHELRTPLNAILGWVRMLRAGTLPPEKQARALETIDRNANAQAQLIEDLLDVSRIISGKLRLEVRSVELGAVVEEAIESVRPAAAAKGLSLTSHPAPGVDRIPGDPDRLRQVVWNLLTNAVKFTPAGGRVEVAIQRHEGSLDVRVSDTGQGIAPEFRKHVFEQFRQADATTTRKHGGLGLGLAIVRSLVELHGGSVRAESAGVGLGATFVVSLPLTLRRDSEVERPPAVRRLTPLGFRAMSELSGVRILVLDDEADARALLTEMLSGTGAKVFSADSVAQALTLVAECAPQVIVSDIGMPGEDGYDFVRKLRALPASSGGRTPAIALTAFCRVEDRSKALAAGFNLHLPKPVEPGELVAGLISLSALFDRR